MLFKLVSLAALTVTALGQQVMDLNATLSSNNDTTALAKLLGSYPQFANGLSAVKDITVLAPSNNAIDMLLNSSTGKMLAGDTGLAEAVLEYHILKRTYQASQITNISAFVPTMLSNTSYTNVTGGQVVDAVSVNNNVTFFSGLNMNTTVLQADVNFTGGVIHIINNVLTIPQNVSATAEAADLTSIVGALTDTKLADTVEALKDVTIFAPSNMAFQLIGSALPNLSTSDLESILKYHVVQGTVGYSTTLKNNTTLKTLQGNSVTVHIEGSKIFVNGAEVITPDVLVANGVVHIIDNVLNPNNTSAAPSASATAGSPGFSGASSVSSAPFTSGVASPSTTAGGGPISASASASAASSKSKGVAVPMHTGAVGAAALFGGAAVMMNL